MVIGDQVSRTLRYTGALLATLLLPTALSAAPITLSASEAPQAAKYVAAVVVAGRGVVAKHQSLINDAAKGDKGFTADYLERALRDDFAKMTGVAIDQIDSPTVRQAVEATLDASSQAVTNNQGRINRPGIGFKGFIPAVYGRVTGNILKGTSGIELKQTTTLYRNAYNKPDAFEAAVLKRFEQGEIARGEGYGEQVANQYRYMQPIYIKEACLSCHGDPKGELDIAGRPKEGYKVGDLRGAISVAIPLTP